jgi:hypothetical protein
MRKTDRQIPVHFGLMFALACVPLHSQTSLSVSPAVGYGGGQNFIFRYELPAGVPAQTLTVANGLLNHLLDGRYGCYFAFAGNPDAPLSPKLLYLVTADGSGLETAYLTENTAVPGTFFPSSVSNGLCTLEGGQSSFQFVGNVVTLNLRISFSSSFGSPTPISPAFPSPNMTWHSAIRWRPGALGTQEYNSGWWRRGVWEVPLSPPHSTYSPKVAGFTPASLTNTSTAVTSVYTASEAGEWITNWVLIGSQFDATKACYVSFYAPGNLLFLIADDGQTPLGPITAGTNGTLTNSQCTLNGIGSSGVTTASGTNTVHTVQFSLTFRPAFEGTKVAWTAATFQRTSDPPGAPPRSSGWQAKGLWQIPKQVTTTIAPSLLEVNIGPLPVDKYNEVLPGQAACPNPSWTVKQCIANMFRNNPNATPYSPLNYRKQGVTGVRFQFALGGGYFSKPFTAKGQIQAAWVSKLQQFFNDLKSYGVERVSPTAALVDNWSVSNGDCIGDGCISLTRFPAPTPAEQEGLRPDGCPVWVREGFFVPWLPFGFAVEQDGGLYPDRADGNKAYECARRPPDSLFWGWTPYLTLVDQILSAARQAGLQVADFDIQNEMNVTDFTVHGRLLYDLDIRRVPGGTIDKSVNVLSEVRERMRRNGFSADRVIGSVPATLSNVPNFTCASVYGDAASLIKLSGMIAAIGGGKIGNAAETAFVNNLPCGGKEEGMFSMPVSWAPLPSLVDTHAHICVRTNSGGQDTCTPDDTTETARLYHDSLYSLLQYRGMSGAYVMFGESNSNQNCDGFTKATAQQAMAGYRKSLLYLNKAPDVSFRPWNYLNGGTCPYQSPVLLNDAYPL